MRQVAHLVSLPCDSVDPMQLFERSDGRYYMIADPQIDLLGDHVVVTRRGSKYSRRGGCKTYVGQDPEDLNQVIARVVHTRVLHGYVEVLSQSLTSNT